MLVTGLTATGDIVKSYDDVLQPIFDSDVYKYIFPDLNMKIQLTFIVLAIKVVAFSFISLPLNALMRQL